MLRKSISLARFSCAAARACVGISRKFARPTRIECVSQPWQSHRPITLNSRRKVAAGWVPPVRPRTIFFTLVRSYATAQPSQSSQLPSLKSILRRFYLLVHPDLFSAYPHQKEVNERSLREFLSFVDHLAQTRRSTGHRVHRKKVTFYLKKSASEGDSPFREVHVELPYNATFAMAKGQIQQLFANCGLPTEFEVEGVSAATQAETIEQFIATHLEHARAKFKETKEHEFNVQRLIKLLQQDYGIIVQNSALFRLYYPHENVRVLNNLIEVFNTLKELRVRASPAASNDETGVINKAADLRGIIIDFDMLETGFPIIDWDAGGVVHLPRDGNPVDWLRFFAALDSEKVRTTVAERLRTEREQDTRMAALRSEFSAKRERVCELLGIGDIVPLSEDVMMPNTANNQNADDSDLVDIDIQEQEKKYTELIERFAAASAELKHLRKVSPRSGKKKKMTVTVCTVLPASTVPESLQYKCSIGAEGEFWLLADVTPREAFEAISKFCAAAHANEQTMLQWAAVRDNIECRLGLRALGVSHTFLQSVPDAAAKEQQALMKLRDNADVLRELGVRGLQLAISDEYSVGEDGTLYIPWDFKMEDLKKLLLKAPST